VPPQFRLGLGATPPSSKRSLANVENLPLPEASEMIGRWLEKLRHWFSYRPERRYMRGRVGSS
jgi:hypothetical protein